MRLKSVLNLEKPPKIDKSLLFVCCLLLVTAAACNHVEPPQPNANGIDTGDASAAAAKVTEADKLYAAREDLGKAREAVALLRQAQLADYGSYEAAWKLARAEFYVGDHTDNDGERESAFREGVDAGKAAVKLQDGKPEGHFWLGANYGGSAKHSTLAGLSNVEDIRREMETVIKLDEGFQNGSAYLGLGQLYLQAPRVLGGDTEKAIGYLEKGLKFGSDNALLRLRLAEAYHAANRNQDARKQIDFIMTMKSDPFYEAERKEAVAGAQKLLEQMK